MGIASHCWPVSFFVAAVVSGIACRAEAPAPTAPTGAAEVDLPGVDTQEFTPRERREFSRYVTELPAPCTAVAVSVADCLLRKLDCPACLPSARVVAGAVRDGMAPDQVQSLYKSRFDAKSAKSIPVDGSPTRGPDRAPVTVVEFADFECPFCQRLAPELEAAWEKRKSDVRFVFKYMPLAMHPHGEIAARAAIAAQAQGKVWEMHRLLFASSGRLDASDLEGYAKTLGLDVERFKADMQSPATKARIDADRKLADTLGVKGTPTLFIDGREYDTKLDMNEWLDSEVSASRAR